MVKKQEVIAIVHAKGKSERIKNKNTRILGDKPLFCHAIEIAKNSNVDKVVIDSDSDEILKIGESYNAIPLKRPPGLATNDADGNDIAYWAAVNYPESYAIVEVMPTSPFIKSERINEVIKMLKKSKLNCVFSVRKEQLYKWESYSRAYSFNDIEKIPNSSELYPTIWETTGLYANRTKSILKLKKRINLYGFSYLEISKIEAIDINTEEDFEFAKIVWQGLNVHKQTQL